MLYRAASPKKKFLSLLLFFYITIDPLMGTFAWLYYKKIILKWAVLSHIQAGIDRSELVLFKFSKEETKIKLRWEHSREFELDGHMYDVVEAITLGDTVYYWCWRDDEETALNRKLEEFAAKALGEDAKSITSLTFLISSFKSAVGTFSEPWHVPTPGWQGKQFPVSFYFYRPIPIQPPTPPPRFS